MFSASTFNVSNRFGLDVASAAYGNLSQGWGGLQRLLEYNYTGGTIFENPIVTSYQDVSFLESNKSYFTGAVLHPSGDIYFVPYAATRGFRFNSDGTTSTYNLRVINSNGGYYGGVLNISTGHIFFIPYNTNVITRVIPNQTNNSPIVSTFTMPTFSPNGFMGGVLDNNNEIHFIPYGSPVGAKLVTTNSVITYTLPNYYTTFNYRGGVLDSENNICFIPSFGDNVSEDIMIKLKNGVFTPITLNNFPNGSNLYHGGVLDIFGNIHFVPDIATVGYKVDVNGNGDTYNLPSAPVANNHNFAGGVLAPDGYVHFIPKNSWWGMKISPLGIGSTYPLGISNASNNFIGGCLGSDGKIYYAQYGRNFGVYLDTTSVIGYEIGTALSPHLKGF